MTNQQTREDTKPREEIVYKFSNKGQGKLREAAIIEGKPYFVKYFCDGDRRFIQVEPKIIDATPILRPPLAQEYPNNNPYEFKTVDEPQRYLQRALKETPDSLLLKIKNTVKNFNAISEYTENLLSLTVFNSYFQDRFSTVYYNIIVGANGTGKSAFGDTFESLAYRAIKATNTTDAFWFRIFGNIEYGQVTIIAEEFDRMDESSQIMTVLKEGYQPNTRVPRMNSNNDKMEFFNPFGFKIIIAEKSPSDFKSRGVLDRSFKIKSYKGFPDYNIKEIRNPQGNARRQQLFDELDDLRKLLLMYRLIHIKDPYKEIRIGLHGRDEELCKPTIQLFHTLGTSDETIKKIEETFQYFLDVKNNRKNDLLETTIYPIVKGIVSPINLSIPGSDIWTKITDSLDGKLDDKDSNLFHSDDFGKIHRITITKMICDKFGAEIDHKRKGNNLLFDYNHLMAMEKIYKNQGKIKTEPVLGDSVIRQCGHVEEDDNSNHNKSGSKSEDNGDSKTLGVQQVENIESPNHTKEKCPYCDYEEHPFYLKIHKRNVHPEQD
jgi:DNA-directed RNA polymerase subunit M/transcription elongation factor TFIIS